MRINYSEIKIADVAMPLSKRGRPRGQKGNRLPFTTSINEDYIKLLKMEAVEKGVTAADIINELLGYYLSRTK